MEDHSQIPLRLQHTLVYPTKHGMIVLIFYDKIDFNTQPYTDVVQGNMKRKIAARNKNMWF